MIRGADAWSRKVGANRREESASTGEPPLRV